MQLGQDAGGLENNPRAIVIIVFVILAGLLLNWFQRKWMKGMSFRNRVFFIGIGALILGGVFYGFVYNVNAA
ncbi:hypothetical protein [Cryptosporangium arvum]|uniref:Uncharacterized protein n=1 Tax=Cryptosporangium arvum DSM 44712 TaxID=927661 RepID=A0A010ZU91_9ACTN|nr:hypothetical protein [Cryptosporangium arvum]EXG80747.1 hypothetical protein CryarDRAFT_1836 [Cryptosporangium arvum DSM 44712]